MGEKLWSIDDVRKDVLTGDLSCMTGIARGPSAKALQIALQVAERDEAIAVEEAKRGRE